MNVAFFISRRLRLTPGDDRRVSTNVAIAVAGIACAVAVMLLSLGIVLGFKDAIKQKVAGFEPSLSIEPASNVRGDALMPVALSSSLSSAINDAVPGAKAYPAVRHAGILKTDTDFLGVVLRSLPGNQDGEDFLRSNLVDGTLSADSSLNVVLSSVQASKLELSVGDKVYAYFFVNDGLKARRFTVGGIFQSNFGDYDELVAYLPLQDLQSICGLQANEGLRLEIDGIPEGEIKSSSELLQRAVNKVYSNCEISEPLVVDTVLRAGAMYYNWLGLLDTNVVVILLLMGCVSGFTLMSSVFILILERVRLIGQLKSLGATDALIRHIFMLLGGRIVLIGLVIGNVIALGVLLSQQAWHYLPLDPKAYYLSYVPVTINWLHVGLLNLGVIVVSALVMLLPAAVVARISPAKTIRFE